MLFRQSPFHTHLCFISCSARPQVFVKNHCRISSCVLVRPRPSISFSGTMMAMKNMIGTFKSWNGKRPRKGPVVLWVGINLGCLMALPERHFRRPRVQHGQGLKTAKMIGPGCDLVLSTNYYWSCVTVHLMNSLGSGKLQDGVFTIRF